MTVNTTTASNHQLEEASNNPSLSEQLRNDCLEELERRKAEAHTNY